MNTNDLSRFTRDLARRDSDSASAARSREDLRLACIAHIKQTEMRKTDPSGFAWDTMFDKALAAYVKTFRRTSPVAKPNSRTTSVTTNTPPATSPATSDSSAVAVTLSLDNSKVQRWFGTSRVESLRKLTSTEYGLLNEVLKAYPEYTIEQVIREGTQYYAKRLMALANSADAKRTPRRKGVANARIAKVYAKMEAANEKARAAGEPAKSLSAASIAVAAKTNIATVRRFLEERERNPPAPVIAPVTTPGKNKAAAKKTTTARGRKTNAA